MLVAVSDGSQTAYDIGLIFLLQMQRMHIAVGPTFVFILFTHDYICMYTTSFDFLKASSFNGQKVSFR